MASSTCGTLLHRIYSSGNRLRLGGETQSSDAEEALRQKLSAAESKEQACAAEAAQAGQRAALLQQELGEEKGRSLRAEEAAREESAACASLREVLAKGDATSRLQKLQEEHATYRRGAYPLPAPGPQVFRRGASLWRCFVGSSVLLRAVERAPGAGALNSRDG